MRSRMNAFVLAGFHIGDKIPALSEEFSELSLSEVKLPAKAFELTGEDN
jgi:hypothetical protein